MINKRTKKDDWEKDLEIIDFHFGCGNNNKRFMKEGFSTDEEERIKCCGCYPHPDCIGEKILSDIIAQIKPIIRHQKALSEEEGFLRGFNTCKSMVEKGEHLDCCIKLNSKAVSNSINRKKEG